MRKTIFLLILLIFLSSQQMVAAQLVENHPSEQIEVRRLDKEAEILAEYLATYNSPLQYHAQDFVDAARVYDLDWRLVAAISGVESTFGKFIPGGYNGWGWGVYGNQAIYFNSWREGIFTVSKGLREEYINKGLTDPYSMNRIYAASPSWGYKVTYFMNGLDKFAREYQNQIGNIDVNPATQIAVASGQLAFQP